jgi:hypothetical protein
MTPTILLRCASLLALVHSLLHTFGGLLAAPSHGADEERVLATMKSLRFDFMGSARSYWDFYFGFGLFLTVALVLQAVLLWQLAALARTEPDQARPFLATLFVSFLAAVLLSWRYFFVAPLVMEAVIAALVGLAWVLSGRRRAAEWAQ